MQTAPPLSVRLGQLTRPAIDDDVGPEFKKFELFRKGGLGNRIRICINICAAVKMLYAAGDYNIIDLKPDNILVTATGNVALIDLDSIQVKEGGTVKFEGLSGTDGYKPPEGAGKTISIGIKDEHWDAFALAVVLYQVCVGAHPYAASFHSPFDKCFELNDKVREGLFVYGTHEKHIKARHRDHDTFRQMPDEIKALFQLAFATGQRDRRPSVDDWGAALNSVAIALEGGRIDFDPVPAPPKRPPASSSGGPPPGLGHPPRFAPGRAIQPGAVAAAPLVQGRAPVSSGYQGWLWIAGFAVLGLFILTQPFGHRSSPELAETTVASTTPVTQTIPAAPATDQVQTPAQRPCEAVKFDTSIAKLICGDQELSALNDIDKALHEQRIQAEGEARRGKIQGDRAALEGMMSTCGAFGPRRECVVDMLNQDIAQLRNLIAEDGGQRAAQDGGGQASAKLAPDAANNAVMAESQPIPPPTQECVTFNGQQICE